LDRKQIDRIEEMLVPFGIIDNGTDYEDMDDRINRHRDMLGDVTRQANMKYF
jgi:hypothetical protein